MKLEMLPYKNVNLKTNKILEQLTVSSRALAELKGYANTIPNMHILINAVTINEAKDSSAIENIVTTHDDIYKVLTESGFKEENAKEVVDYRNAIWAGYEQIKKDGFINTNTIVKIQGIIEHNNAGIRKLPGTELKNSLTGETIYTPPQNEEEIRDYLRNLEKFINNNEDGIDPLIKVCLIHYQFESIHPFYDGNGRTGRILNILYLVLNKLIDSPILYLSKYINKTKQEYYKLFNEVRNNNNYEEWILYILKGIEITSKETITLIEKIQDEMKNFKEEFRTKLPKIYSKELLESLFYEVYTKIAYIEKACDVTSEEEKCNEKDNTKTNFNEINFDEAIQYFTQEKSGVLYFGFSSCPWCKEAKPILKKVAKDNGIDIQYVKVRDEEKNRLYTDEQKAIIEPYIQDYMSNNDEGVLTLYVPLVLVIKNGKIIDGHEGTLESHDATERKMTNDEKEQLTKIYTKLMSEAK